MTRCEECGGTGELEEHIFNSQPPDWRVIPCYECNGTGENNSCNYNTTIY